MVLSVGSGLKIHVLCGGFSLSLNFKLLVLSVGSGLKIHVLCGGFSLSLNFKLLVLSVGSRLKIDALFNIYCLSYVFKHTYVSQALMHYESLAHSLPSRTHEISLGDGILGASSTRAYHDKPCHIYHKGDYAIPKCSNTKYKKTWTFFNASAKDYASKFNPVRAKRDLRASNLPAGKMTLFQR